ncbi:MAG: DNA-deoxyinosine glycosylase [Piscirickettsiaceae bacterium]|nr:DNA-deoxyinosine glycosylase [Piscirickettsiaceae bacterium]
MDKEIPLSISFPPIESKDAQILILGSMPSIKSLQQQQYYAHPRNAFWPIMSELFDMQKDWDYQQRCEHLLKNKVAVWDVLKACQRKGSLDQHIEPQSMIANDFNAFFQRHRYIRQIFFNGAKAEQVFDQHVLPTLTGKINQISFQRLPSTSPAHAAMTLEQKFHIWQTNILTG